MIQLILEPLLFILFIVSCLYLPGKLLLSKLKLELSPLEDIFLPMGLGIVVFTFVAYLLSWIKLEILILPIFILLDVFAIKNKLYLPQKITKLHLLPLGITGIMSFIFSLKMLIAGQYGNSILIGYDDSWRLALIQELKVHFPPFNPGFANIPLKGYHFFYDLFAAKISNIFNISPLSLHFHLIPLFLAFMWGLGVYTLMFKWTKKTSAGLWAVFLTMFGGSFAFIFNLFVHPGVNLDNGLGIGLPTWSLYNPPLAISLIIILTSLFMIYNFLSDKRQAWLIPLVLCIGMISMFKVYAGMLLIGVFLLLVFLELFKKNYKIIFFLIIVLIIFLSTFWLFVGGTGSLVFFPYWGPERLLQSFSWFHYDNKIYVYGNYVSSGSNIIHGLIGLIYTYSFGLFLFIIGNLGTKIFGILALLILFFKHKKKTPSLFSMLIFSMILASILIPLFFIQTGKVFEIIQMAQYYLFLCSLLAAFGFSILFEIKFNKLIKVVFVSIIILLSIPHMYGILSGYVKVVSAFQSLNSPYYQTMHYMASVGKYDDTVLELPPKDIAPDYKSILFWHEHTSTPLLNALANKRSYFNNEFIDFPNLDIRSRIDFLIKIIPLLNNDVETTSESNERTEISKLLKEKNIKYIYSSYEITFPNKNLNILKIYENEKNFVYKVNYN